MNTQAKYQNVPRATVLSVAHHAEAKWISILECLGFRLCLLWSRRWQHSKFIAKLYSSQECSDFLPWHYSVNHFSASACQETYATCHFFNSHHIFQRITFTSILQPPSFCFLEVPVPLRQGGGGLLKCLMSRCRCVEHVSFPKLAPKGLPCGALQCSHRIWLMLHCWGIPRDVCTQYELLLAGSMQSF